MKNLFRFTISFIILSAFSSALFAEVLSGTYSSDYTVKTSFNEIPSGKTLTITNNSTFYLKTDMVIRGTLEVKKGSFLIAPVDGTGFISIMKGAKVTGVDFYYKTLYGDKTEHVRKIPVSFEEIWTGKYRDGIEFIENISFHYEKKYNGWVQDSEGRNGNPFNEDLYADYVQTWEKSEVIKTINNEYSKIIVKPSAKVVISAENADFFRVNDLIQIEEGGEFISDRVGIFLKQGCKVEGLPLCCIFDNKFYEINDLAALWKLDVFGPDEYQQIFYDFSAGHWYFQATLGSNEVSKKKLPKFTEITTLVE